MKDKSEQEWISVDDRLPEVGQDLGEWTNSICVLISNGEECWVGYNQTWWHSEHPPQWKIKGRDSYDINEIARGPITHWMPLPSPPDKSGKPVNIRRGKFFMDEDAFEVGKLAMEYLQKLFEEEREA